MRPASPKQKPQPAPTGSLTRKRIKPRPIATFDMEIQAYDRGLKQIAGIDEAGRGPWAGPVVAAAVILTPDAIPNGIADSKALDEIAREALFAKIQQCADIGIGIASVERIDRDNILAATMWAMGEAVSALKTGPCLALVDGNRAPPLACPARTIIKGDATCLSIAAASIIAKVTRDRLMRDLARSYPAYGFEKHKGYGTPQHQLALARHGITPHHRRSFKPIRARLDDKSETPD